MQNDILGEFVPDMLLMRVSEAVADDTDQASYSRTFIHEYVHWMQFTGTNWGFMQLMLGQNTINSFFNLANFGDLKAHLEGFRKISINGNLRASVPDEYQRTAGIFCQNWIDSFLTKKILSSSSNNAIQMPNADQSVAVGLCDYTNGVNFLLGEPEQNIDKLEKTFTFPNLIGMRLNAFEEFTTFDLIEGQAKINEVLHEISLQVSAGGVFNIDFSKFLKGEYPPVYAKAFKVYCELTGKNFQFDQSFTLYPFIEACIEFAVIVDISLAITAPPFLPSHAYHYISWQVIYPPIRFYRLCESAAKLDFSFNNELNSASYAKFSSAVCKTAGLPDPVDQARFFLNNHDSAIKELENRWSFKTLEVEKLLGITDLLLFLCAKFNQLRLEQPEMICLPGWSDVTAKMIKLQWNDEFYWLHCPFEVRGTTFYNRIPKKLTGLSGYLIGLLVTNKVLEQHILRNIPLDQISFPFNVDDRLKEMVTRNIKQLIGVTIEWK